MSLTHTHKHTIPKSIFLYLLCHIEYINMNFSRKHEWRMQKTKKKQNTQTNLNLIISLSQLYGTRTVALNFGCTLKSLKFLKHPVPIVPSLVSEVRIYRAGDEGGMGVMAGLALVFFSSFPGDLNVQQGLVRSSFYAWVSQPQHYWHLGAGSSLNSLQWALLCAL